MNRKPVIFTAKVISLGRITIPDELRSLHDIHEGYFVELELRSVQKPPEGAKKK